MTEYEPMNHVLERKAREAICRGLVLLVAGSVEGTMSLGDLLQHMREYAKLGQEALEAIKEYEEKGGGKYTLISPDTHAHTLPTNT